MSASITVHWKTCAKPRPFAFNTANITDIFSDRYVCAAPPCRCAFVGDAVAMQAYRDMVAQRRLQQPDNVSGGGGVNLVNEMQGEMDDESGTNFDDMFYPGF